MALGQLRGLSWLGGNTSGLPMQRTLSRGAGWESVMALTG